ncbi:hypothetical protein [uncultured Psychroserpens sp.]|uniref:hypothetical protein n=1 Tax=uncultured Psychroserpens sp. TaxID=255436 RepID=UPI0026110CB2|nr:hypothetical protein [uncultured Psychroserpens sp.]
MKIKSDASSTEILSPFYKKNQEFCQEFENYIASKKGKVKGTYNAWSYLIYGKIDQPRSWTLMYEKSTFTYNWNIFLSSKKQSLRIRTKWSTQLDTNLKFTIRRKSILDTFNKSTSTLNKHSKYVLISDQKPSKLISDLIIILSSLFENKNVHLVTLKNGKLMIKLDTETHELNSFEKLLAIV